MAACLAVRLHSMYHQVQNDSMEFPDAFPRLDDDDDASYLQSNSIFKSLLVFSTFFVHQEYMERVLAVFTPVPRPCYAAK